MVSKQDITRYRLNLQDEIDSAALYETLAEVEPKPELAQVYRRLAEVEKQHAKFWEEKLRKEAGINIATSPGWRSRMLAWLAKRFGPQFVLPTINAEEQQDRTRYNTQADAKAAGFPAHEASHARLLRVIAGPSGIEGSTLARLEGRHRAVGGNALRAAVLGVNDGLVSNLSLVMGVAGANLSPRAIVITGMAGLLAGACSMAMGEWVSVQSARELYERQIAVEAEETSDVPEEEAEELALIHQAKGLNQEEARKLAGRLITDEQSALTTLSREELGIDPAELGGSALAAAATSFVLFIVGAILPLSAFFIWFGATAVVTSGIVSSVALFLIGGAITLPTGKGILHTGFRQLLFGLGAAAATFGIGRLLGVSLMG